MITTFYPPYNFGGDGMFVHRLSNELAARGHSVEVIHCVDSYRLLTRKIPNATYADHPNVIVHGLKSPLGFLSPLATQQTGFSFLKSARIRQILKKGFDVIHYHNISLVGGPKVLEYGKGIKLYTMHEYWLVCPTHVLFQFNRKACFHPKCLLCTLTYKRPPKLWRYFDLFNDAFKHVDVFIAPSRSCKQIHHRMGMDLPIVHLPNFVVSTNSGLAGSEESMGDLPDGPFFLFVGRLEKLKGLQTLIPVFRRYLKAQLLIAGTGSYEPFLRRLAGDSDNIRFLGYLSEKQLHTFYRQATALLVPSLCLEIFALVILEAFREKTPVIVKNLGGMPELIKESGGGCIYNTDDDLVAAMDRIMADPSYRNDLGRRGYLTYKQKWTEEAHLKRYFDLINDIKAHRKPISLLQQ
jgi:glycosyltransferase involved in cell wall biosynthesis